MSAATSGACTQCHRAGQLRPIGKASLSQAANFRRLWGPVPPTLAPGPSTSRTSGAVRGLTVVHARRKWYAIFEPAAARGVYRLWEHVKHFVTGQANAVHKGFPSEAAALEWISQLTLRYQEESLQKYMRISACCHLYKLVTLPWPCRGLDSILQSLNLCRSTLSSSCAKRSLDRATVLTPPIVLPVPAAPSREYYRKWYAVRFVDGGSPAVYNTWQETEAAISGRYAEHRSFDSRLEALLYAFGPTYVDQLLQDEQLLQQLQPDCQAQSVADAAASGYCASPCGVSNEANETAVTSQRGLLTNKPYQPHEYGETYGEQSSYSHVEHGHHGLHGQSAVGDNEDVETVDVHRGAPDIWSFADMAAAVVSRIQGVPASLTNLRTTALASYDAAASRPMPVSPGGGLAACSDQRPPEVPSAASLGWRLPAPTAVTAPLSYVVPYGSPAPAMVLTAAAVVPARTPCRGHSASSPLDHRLQHSSKQQRQQKHLAAPGELQLEVEEARPLPAPYTCVPARYSLSAAASTTPPTTTWPPQDGLLAAGASGRSVYSSCDPEGPCSANSTPGGSLGSGRSEGTSSSCRLEPRVHFPSSPSSSSCGGAPSMSWPPAAALGYDDRGANDSVEVEQPGPTDAVDVDSGSDLDSGGQRVPNLLLEPAADHTRRPPLALANSPGSALTAQALYAHALRHVRAAGTVSASPVSLSPQLLPQQQQADGSTAAPTRRRRGRPRKVVTATMAAAAAAAISLVVSTPPCAVPETSGEGPAKVEAETGSVPPVKRGRGRPPKKATAAGGSVEAPAQAPVVAPKRPRGRPRKTTAASV
ncbi:hypothetical protein VOLCADRAFT_87758 [Volvox carteri f. nagariensis]|uniref:Ribonuclease H1 N-terminal domain-containing protein n=1 Tax=Volvox carteri f. nagariensis TaxID=3068 RepID=D8TM61_VOLCA|nr:uncharacterized protein VOLCADRAFT_87758 [Volvox carteri f. nagariensis]EFJ51445.1 hypothetical protein VOLCADRAFT_87758 [Volvox carteri f. nagariensis]|eukprot:XP_002947397.1 hypothetical protein VOLCADRAFT_87758 [Volvox carteri f. nagariensis]